MHGTAAALAQLAFHLPHVPTAVTVSCCMLRLKQPARPFQYQAARAFGQGFDHAVVAAQPPSAASCVTCDAYACFK